MVKERVGGLQGRQGKCFLSSPHFTPLEGWTGFDPDAISSDSSPAQLDRLGLASWGLETRMKGDLKPDQPRGNCWKGEMYLLLAWQVT